MKTFLGKQTPLVCSTLGALLFRRILVWGLQRSQRIIRNAFRSSIPPDWQIDNGFITGQSWRVLTSWYTGAGARTRILAQFHRRTKPKFISFISSVAQATPNGELTCRLINFLLPSLFQVLPYSVGVEFQRASKF